MRHESIEVTQALRMICDAALRGRIRVMQNEQELASTAADNTFYDTVVTPFCREVVADIACYGLAVYHITANGTPVHVDISDADIYMNNTLPMSFSARHRNPPLGAEEVPLHVTVLELPDYASGKCRGALSRCLSEYIAGRIVWCNELAIGTSNAQSVYTLNHAADPKQMEIMRAVNYANKNTYEGTSSGKGMPNPYGPSAQDFSRESQKITVHSVVYDTELCKQLTENGQKMTAEASQLGSSHPGIMTDVEEDKRACARPAVFIPVPLGYGATQRNYIPEMKSMNTLLEAISRIIYEAFGVAALRSVTSMQNSSLYHSAAELSVQESRLRQLGQRYRSSIREVLAIIHMVRTQPRSIRKAHRGIHKCIMDGGTADAAATAAIATVNTADGTTLEVVAQPTFEFISDMFNSDYLTWDAMRRYMVHTGVALADDLETEDPRRKRMRRQTAAPRSALVDDMETEDPRVRRETAASRQAPVDTKEPSS